MSDFYDARQQRTVADADARAWKVKRRLAALYACSMAGGADAGPHAPGVRDDAVQLPAALGIGPADVRRRR